MRKHTIFFMIVVAVMGFSYAGCGKTANLTSPPMLEVIFTSDDGSSSRINAIGGGGEWYFNNKDGTTGGVLADSPHPLDMGYMYNDDYTIYLNGSGGEIELSFTDNYPPDTVTAHRWNAVYLGRLHDKDIDIYDKIETVSIVKNRFRIDNDGHDFIYVFGAKWNNVNSTSQEGRWTYSFRVNN